MTSIGSWGPFFLGRPVSVIYVIFLIGPGVGIGVGVEVDQEPGVRAGVGIGTVLPRRRTPDLNCTLRKPF